MIVAPSLAEALLFQPDTRDPGPPPALAGVSGRDVSLRAEDGVRLHAWWYEAGPGAPAVVLFHGNAGNLGGRGLLARGLVERGISVLMPDYRGYGASEGSPSEEGLYLDGSAVLDLAAREAGGPGRVVLWGRSLGGAVATRVAAASPVAGVILESAFTSLDRIASSVYPFLPSFFFRRLRGRYDSLSRVGSLGCPLLVVHGTRDRIVPSSMGRTLFEAAPGPREWLPVEGAGHNDVFLVGGDAYFERLAGFVRRTTGVPRDAGAP